MKYIYDVFSVMHVQLSEKRMKRDIITYVITQVCFQNKSFLPFYKDYYANVCINNITEIAYTLSNGFVSDPSNKMLLMIVVRFLWYDSLLLFSKLSFIVDLCFISMPKINHWTEINRRLLKGTRMLLAI